MAREVEAVVSCSECSSFTVECAHCGEPHEFAPSIMQKQAETQALRLQARIDRALELLDRGQQTAGYITNNRLVSVQTIDAIRAALTGEGES